MKPVILNVLLALSDSDRHGYAIMQEVHEYTNGRSRLAPGALYRAIKELVDAELIVETGDRPAPELDDARRRYYRLTDKGREALVAEMSGLQTLVGEAQRRHVLPSVHELEAPVYD